MLDMKRLELQFVTNDAGEKTAVILPIDRFQELIEDIEDLASAAERRDEPTVSHKDLVAELKRDGLI
jgi:hypothetical protein